MNSRSNRKKTPVTLLALSIGLALQAGWTLVTVKLLMVGLLIFFASPTATHALARAAMTRGLKPQLAPPEDASSKP